MTERALTHDALLAGLHDIHLPADAPGGALADLAAAVAMAGVAALLVGGLLRLLARRRPQVGKLSIRDRVHQIAERPDAERRVALLHLLKAAHPDRYAALAPMLYRPGDEVSVQRLEAEVLRRD